ncbi:uracil-regulated protein 1 [Drechslerella stenobrocha 248]|uniref:Uracil-regulated protein 1 n=1 Tax=Drechslerella stenobrocha 248 TaxID=1043628 RepID=W7HXL8_9PEZI|nr:uracil-regulated protein 1 [Drechslerella stenobrocha 248]
MSAQDELLQQILAAVTSLQTENKSISDSVSTLTDRVNRLAIQTAAPPPHGSPIINPIYRSSQGTTGGVTPSIGDPAIGSSGTPSVEEPVAKGEAAAAKQGRSSMYSSRIILTTYPSQSGIDPLVMDWGNGDPQKRGPVVVNRGSTTIRRRNAIGAHGGSYSFYNALAVAIQELSLDHKPDYANTQPAAQIGPYPQWGDGKKIVAMDPFGHLPPWLYKDLIENEGVDIRPTIAITKAHMRLPELEQSVRDGRLSVDGKIVLNEFGEVAVTKVAVEPVWYLPGVAERFGIDEGLLRRSLFENTGGSFPELITRQDIKIFMPPIGGLTVYIFGDPAKTADPNAKLALRIHDECNGSDVFGSDICTCRPYLIFGVEEAVKEAQKGGSGVVIYFRKEGRALGEVTKYLVYNARKRGTDKASEYFQRTSNIAGVKDMRFQALMPDILHWLGITKIDRMLSMSNMKHDAIVEQGIPILERVPIPDEMIPADSRVEIDAKIHAGYFTTGKILSMEELSNVQGRSWEDVDVSYTPLSPSLPQLLLAEMEVNPKPPPSSSRDVHIHTRRRP